ncbi:duf3228 domain-containing protein [Cystoisospora suis]|uniref:Duf3228 domain-containing protein n=1 Tax=Cystoisospora suis TaxID=483139 RepID=A0A2C6LAZ9_9APIC|nr:duf3228 domain-containing protein [Cystoisospora suis]
MFSVLMGIDIFPLKSAKQRAPRLEYKLARFYFRALIYEGLHLPAVGYDVFPDPYIQAGNDLHWHRERERERERVACDGERCSLVSSLNTSVSLTEKETYERRIYFPPTALVNIFHAVKSSTVSIAPLSIYIHVYIYPKAPLWSIISIKAQDENFELPMSPITMLRNTLIEEGGSGVKLDRESYEASVAYWTSHAVIMNLDTGLLSQEAEKKENDDARE